MLQLNMPESEVELASSDEENHSEPERGTANPPETRRQAYRFKDTDDISLLQEVLVERPIGKEGPKKWKAIFQRLGLPLKNYIAVKRRYNHLMSCLKANNLKALRGSGLEENYDEKMRLLTDIDAQMEDWIKEEADQTISAKRKLEESQRKAQTIRDAALGSRSVPDTAEGGSADEEEANEVTPTSKRSKRIKPSDVMNAFKESEENDRCHQQTMADLEKKRLELLEQDLTRKKEKDQHQRDMENRKMDLDEKRIEMDRMRFEKDSEERLLLLKLLQKKLD